MISVRQKAMDAYLLLTRKLSGRGLRLGRWKRLLGLHERALSRLPPPDLARVNVRGHKLWVVPRDIGVAYGLIRYGEHERFETALFEDRLLPGMTVLDVGANVGFHSLLAARMVGTNGRVFAFEPEPGNYQILLRNIRENGYRNIFAFQKAVSASEGVQTLYFDDVNLACPSLSDRNVTRDSGGTEVDTVTLDGFVKQHEIYPDFVKIDIQGAEGLLVEGAEEVLQSRSPTILMEFWPFGLANFGTDPAALLRTFEGYGYRVSLLNEQEERLDEVTVDEALRQCEALSEVKGHVNLLLEKTR